MLFFDFSPPHATALLHAREDGRKSGQTVATRGRGANCENNRYRSGTTGYSPSWVRTRPATVHPALLIIECATALGPLCSPPPRTPHRQCAAQLNVVTAIRYRREFPAVRQCRFAPLFPTPKNLFTVNAFVELFRTGGFGRD